MDSGILLQEANEKKFFISDHEIPVNLRLKREIGDQAIWNVSSAKAGYGVENIRDNRVDTYWQSDATHPHFITIHLNRRRKVTDLAIYFDFKEDESYTPSRIAVRAGNHPQLLNEIVSIDLGQPQGWTVVNLKDSDDDSIPYIEASVFQVQIISNHLNGRDSHVRQIKIFGPRRSFIPSFEDMDFNADDFHTFATVR
eukprot:TRINITY_DN3485_c0_g4_i1.p1 TRINITY_DN3485_c0_g4~~TRINITY_DN3485_c0_g4_i1.p1  ORF type:complete len:197 (+),score=48.11 TRINITY_DN3485_c0_g4_i1:138-728(+)